MNDLISISRTVSEVFQFIIPLVAVLTSLIVSVAAVLAWRKNTKRAAEQEQALAAALHSEAGREEQPSGEETGEGALDVSVA